MSFFSLSDIKFLWLVTLPIFLIFSTQYNIVNKHWNKVLLYLDLKEDY